MTAEPTTRPADGGTDVPEPPPTAAAEGGDRHPRRWSRWLPRYTWSGTVGALLFGCLSLTPSLLPRGWVLQGLIAGITAAIGYGVGVTVAWFVAELTESRMSAGFRRRAWQVLAAAGALLCVVMLWLGAGWQRDIHELMGLDAPAGYTVDRHRRPGSARRSSLFVAIGRGIRWLGRGLVRLFGRILPRRVARPLGVVVATALVIFLLNGVLLQGLVEAINSAFSVKDDGTEEGAVEPTASERSGSPDVPRAVGGPGPAGAQLRREGPDAGRARGLLRRARPGAGPRVRRAASAPTTSATGPRSPPASSSGPAVSTGPCWWS